MMRSKCSQYILFNDTATTEIYTLSLHDALPIWGPPKQWGKTEVLRRSQLRSSPPKEVTRMVTDRKKDRSEEHTSELPSHLNLVCRLLLEKKKKNMLRDSKFTTQHRPATSYIDSH